LPHVPGTAELMQLLVDYPGGWTDYCQWDPAGGRAVWRADRGASGSYYLEGWIDNVVTPCADAPPIPPVCYDFDASDHGLYTFLDSNGYRHGAVPAVARTVVDGDVLDFVFHPSECFVPGTSGDSEIIGFTNAGASYVLGLLVSYDDYDCCRIQLRSNGLTGQPFLAETGRSYRVNIRYEGGSATLNLLEGCHVRFTDVLAHAPGQADLFQFAVDYPGGGTDYCHWNADDGRVDWRVDRGTGYFLAGWIDDVHTPGCLAVPPPPVVCYDFNQQDHGLHTFVDGSGYLHGVFPVTPRVIGEGESLAFDYHVSECLVPGVWGANEIIGLTSPEQPGLLGLLVTYDDGDCCRIQLCSNDGYGQPFQGEPGRTYRVVITYAGGQATLTLHDGGTLVFTDALVHTPGLADQMQVMVDYPGGGTEYCTWDALEGRVDWRVDRATGYHLAGWIDNVATPGCEVPAYVCYDFDESSHGLASVLDSYGYTHSWFPTGPHTIAEGEAFEFSYGISDCLVPGSVGANEIIGLTNADWSYYLGLLVTYDDGQCCRLQLCSNGVYGQVYVASSGSAYRVRIEYRDGTAHLTLNEGAVVAFTDALPHTPGIADWVQVAVDYPGGDTEYCRWENGRVEWRVDRATGYHLAGWCDDFVTPGCWERTSETPLPAGPGPGVLTLGVRPNPARESVTLAFGNPVAGPVALEVFDAGGRLVRRVVDADLPAGSHTLSWDLRDAAGSRAASGVYFARLVSGHQTVTRTVVLAR